MSRRPVTKPAVAGPSEVLASLSSSEAAEVGPQWQPDGAGSLARIGVLTPDFDPVPESEMWAMAPQGVSVHASRVFRTHGDARSFADLPHVDAAVDLLARLGPRAIIFAFTSSSYVPGVEVDERLRTRLAMRAGGIPVILPAPSASEAFRALRVRRVALIHPPWFSAEVNDKATDYFRARGFEVIFSARITPLRPFAEVPPAEVYDWTRANVPREAEAVFLGGNGLRAIGVIGALEETLGRPVLTANQVAFWEALRHVGAAEKVRQYGRIFTDTGAQ